MSALASTVARSTTAIVKVGLVSLGCAKNLVDSEIMAGHLHQAGMALTPNPDEADVMIVNTCSFIDAAKEESIGAILDANRDRGMRRRHRAAKADRGRLHGAAFRRRVARVDARGRRLHRPGPAHANRADHRGPPRKRVRGFARRTAGEFRHAAAEIHSRLRHAALPPHAFAHRLREDRRGLQSSLLVLHHSADARASSQPHGRVHRGRGARPSWPRACGN